MAAASIALSSGFKVPIIGLGVWRMEEKSIRDLIISSIKIGYRHFDCADHGQVVEACKDSLKNLQDNFGNLLLLVADPPQWIAYGMLSTLVNPIETHPYFQRDSHIKFCQKHGVCVTAHTPLRGAAANTELSGSVSSLDNPVLKSLAEKYKKTIAQLVLRWGIQRNSVVIPKSSKLERLQENFRVFDFNISGEDMEKIEGIDQKYRTNQPAKF